MRPPTCHQSEHRRLRGPTDVRFAAESVGDRGAVVLDRPISPIHPAVERIIADGSGEASQAKGVAKDLSLNGTCHPVAALEFHPTLLPRLDLGPAHSAPRS